MKIHLLFAAALITLFTACGVNVERPTDFTNVDEAANIYPDYRNITIPCNIAPLNIQVKSDAKAYFASIACGNQEVIAGAGEDGKLFFDEAAWKELLTASKGKQLKVNIYAETEGGWVKHPEYTIDVAQEEIDPFLTYRLIEPSYELYRQLGIYQRNVTNFDEKVVYENNPEYNSEDNHCINCHNFQNYSTDNMLFHVRAGHGGTVFIQNGKVRKLNMKSDSILYSTVYPTWHREKPWVVFSSNRTGQAFHMIHGQKIEVIDYGSDLVFFDVEKETLTNILKTDDVMETFPCWAPDGSKVYYCAAQTPYLKGLDTKAASDAILPRYDSIRYNLMSIPFDAQTKTFGTPEVEVDCNAMGKSAAVPKVSPDGRFVLFTMADYGQFHIWHHSADLYVKDLQSGEVRPLDKANSFAADSYHSWSSNGRWLVVASRREDGSYSRPYIAYFDKEGKAHKAFLLPQKDPEFNLLRMKSYNVPEFSKNAITVSSETLKEVIYDDKKANTVKYSNKIK